MISWCFNCGKMSFDKVCPSCQEEYYDDYIPLDPTYYPELNYKSKGFIQKKRKTTFKIKKGRSHTEV